MLSCCRRRSRGQEPARVRSIVRRNARSRPARGSSSGRPGSRCRISSPLFKLPAPGTRGKQQNAATNPLGSSAWLFRCAVPPESWTGLAAPGRPEPRDGTSGGNAGLSDAALTLAARSAISLPDLGGFGRSLKKNFNSFSRAGADESGSARNGSRAPRGTRSYRPPPVGSDKGAKIAFTRPRADELAGGCRP